MTRRVSRSARTMIPLGLVLFAASAAWACTAVPSVSTGLRSGPAGMHIPLDGTGFAPAEVEIRWNTVDGPIVGAAMGPDFSTTIATPEAYPGVYYILAVQRRADGSIIGKASDTFQMLVRSDSPPSREGSSEARSASTSTAGLWDGFSNLGASAPDRVAPLTVATEGNFPALLVGLGLVTAGAGALTAGLLMARTTKRRSISKL